MRAWQSGGAVWCPQQRASPPRGSFAANPPPPPARIPSRMYHLSKPSVCWLSPLRLGRGAETEPLPGFGVSPMFTPFQKRKGAGGWFDRMTIHMDPRSTNLGVCPERGFAPFWQRARGMCPRPLLQHVWAGGWVGTTRSVTGKRQRPHTPCFCGAASVSPSTFVFTKFCHPAWGVSREGQSPFLAEGAGDVPPSSLNNMCGRVGGNNEACHRQAATSPAPTRLASVEQPRYNHPRSFSQSFLTLLGPSPATKGQHLP